MAFRFQDPQQISTFLSTDRSGVQFTPEYSHSHFFFAVSNSSYRVKAADLMREQAAIMQEIFRTSGKTKCTVFYTREFNPSNLMDQFFSLNPELKKMYARGRLEFQLIPHKMKIWAQDFGQGALRKDGSYEFMTGIEVDPKVQNISRANINSFYEKIPVTQIPLAFEGGDVATTMLDGKKTVVIGPQTANTTRIYYERLGYKISDNEIKKILQHAFNADKIILLGCDNNTYLTIPYIFHLDQAIFFPKADVAVIIDPDSITDKRMHDGLVEYSRQLEEAGFKVIKIPSTVDHIKKYQAYVNSIALTSDTVKILMPSFGDSLLEQKIKEILELNGFQVVFIANTTYPGQGNIHCITGGFARLVDAMTPKKIV
ncbi:MAG: agmatine deiminase family protein [Candidatus Micrarchaeota archaeon]